MLLVDLKKIVETEAGCTVTDCVVAVPTYFDEAERYAMLNAATIAGLNCLRLINENTATALAYGIYKTDLPETEAVNVAFVDVGNSSTQVGLGFRVRCWGTRAPIRSVFKPEPWIYLPEGADILKTWVGTAVRDSLWGRTLTAVPQMPPSQPSPSGWDGGEG